GAGQHETVAAPAHSLRALLLKVPGAWPEPVHSPVLRAGALTTGMVVSLTVTLKEAVSVLPLPSAAVQVTVVAPSGKLLPEAGTQVTETVPAQPSRALALKVTAAWPEPVHSAARSAATLTTGM